MKYPVFDASYAAKPWLAMLVVAAKPLASPLCARHAYMPPPWCAFVPVKGSLASVPAPPRPILPSFFSQGDDSYFFSFDLCTYVVIPKIAVVTLRTGNNACSPQHHSSGSFWPSWLIPIRFDIFYIRFITRTYVQTDYHPYNKYLHNCRDLPAIFCNWEESGC